jgi:hypothetical protein
MADASVSVLVLLLNAIWPDMLAGGVQTALEKVWKKLTAKDWEDLYFDAFELAVKKQSPSLVHYHEGQAAFNRTAFKRLLKEELHISIRDSAGSQLLSREFLVAVAGAIARRSNEIFVLPGNLLSELDYQQLTFNLVAEANSLFWTEIHRRPDAFNKEILAELKLGQERLQEVQDYLAKLEQSAQHHIREIHSNLQELNDLGKKAAEYQAACISCAEPGLYFLVQVIQETLNAHNFRTIHLETSDIPRQVLEEEIRGCSYFFGLYSENYYDSNLINDREAISNVERHIEIART